MVVIMFLKNGKSWENAKVCQYDDGELKQIYDYTHISGSMTEMPEDFLPKSYKTANSETVAVMECLKCEKHFVTWFNGEVQSFHESRTLPNGDYSREGEATEIISPVISESDLQDVEKGEEGCNCGGNGNCDKGGKCPDCNSNKYRPNFYG
jgi:hypothetical protein